MSRLELDYFDAMSSLLVDVVNSVDTLEVIVHLYQTRFHPQDALSIGRRLRLSPRSVAEALAALLRAGVVRTHHNDDDAGWWFDANSSWATSIEVLVELYEMDRAELLGFMKHIALQAVRSDESRASVYLFARRRKRRPTAPS